METADRYTMGRDEYGPVIYDNEKRREVGFVLNSTAKGVMRKLRDGREMSHLAWSEKEPERGSSSSEES